jgi:hypothetical protein
VLLVPLPRNLAIPIRKCGLTEPAVLTVIGTILAVVVGTVLPIVRPVLATVLTTVLNLATVLTTVLNLATVLTTVLTVVGAVLAITRTALHGGLAVLLGLCRLARLIGRDGRPVGVVGLVPALAICPVCTLGGRICARGRLCATRSLCAPGRRVWSALSAALSAVLRESAPAGQGKKRERQRPSGYRSYLHEPSSK